MVPPPPKIPTILYFVVLHSTDVFLLLLYTSVHLGTVLLFSEKNKAVLVFEKKIWCSCTHLRMDGFGGQSHQQTTMHGRRAPGERQGACCRLTWPHPWAAPPGRTPGPRQEMARGHLWDTARRGGEGRIQGQPTVSWLAKRFNAHFSL